MTLLSQDPNIRLAILAGAKKRFDELHRREHLEGSLLDFMESGWRYIDPAPFVGGWHLEAIAEHLQAVTDGQIRRLIINVPPRTSKSSLVSVAWPAWTWAQTKWGPCSGPHVQFLTSSYAQTLSLRDSVKTRRLIESPFYQEYWGDRFRMTGDVNTKGRFENDKGGYRLATSVDGTLTGEGGQCFPAGTLVKTTQGGVPIEKIKVGMEVLALDHSRGRVVSSVVKATRALTNDILYEFHTDAGHSFRCTSDHPVFVPMVGYISAHKLGKGDWLLREAGQAGGPKSGLRGVWGSYPETALRGQKGHQNTLQRRLLFGRLQKRALFCKDFKVMRHLWECLPRPAFSLLFQVVQTYCQLREKKEEFLPSLQQRVRGIYNILQRSMCGQGAFPAYAGVAELKVQGSWEIFQPVQRNVQTDTGARQSLLCGLRFARQAYASAKQEVLSFFSSCASYRREHEEQRSKEPSASLSLLSQEAPSWDFDRITSVTVHRGEEHRVYDIQVARFRNFFANGILVHNCIILDDPHNATEAESDLVRKSTIEWWDEAMSTRLNDPATGAYVVIMQRLHMEDLTGYILGKEASEWVHLMLPMRHDTDRHCTTYIQGVKFWDDPRVEEDELLCDARFPMRQVLDLERRLGPYAAAGQLQQLPAPRGGGIIKEEWWQKHVDSKFPSFSFVLASLDTAYTEKEENDPSALTIWGVFQDAGGNPKVMLMYGWEDRLSLKDLVDQVTWSCSKSPIAGIPAKLPEGHKFNKLPRFQVDRLIIEAKAAGISTAQELRRLYAFDGHFGVELVNISRRSLAGGGDKIARLYSVQHLWAEGLIYVPFTEPYGYTWANKIVDQISVFPKGAHDDFVDTASMAIRYLRDTGMLQRKDEYELDVAQELAYRGRTKSLYPV